MLSERKSIAQAEQARAQAFGEVLKAFVPQLFSSPRIMSDGAPDVGGVDEWKLSNFPADVLIPLASLELIAKVDERSEIHDFVMLCLRGFKGVGGFANKQGENIAIGLAGVGGRGKIVKKPGWAGRHITNRDWHQKAKDEGATIAE